MIQIDDAYAYAGRYGGQSWAELDHLPLDVLFEKTKALERLVEAENKANKG